MIPIIRSDIILVIHPSYNKQRKSKISMHKKTFLRPMAQAVHRHSLTSEKWIQSQGSLRETCGGQSDTGTDISPSTSFFSVNIIPTIFHARPLVTDAV
jgi:hypothetical protein